MSAGAGMEGARAAGRGAGGKVLNVAFFDVDGTLVYRDSQNGSSTFPSRRVADAVCAFADAGGVPILSTGRSRLGIADLLGSLPFRGYVSMDGAYVAIDERVLQDRCIPHDLLEKMVTEMLSVGMSAFFQGTEQCIELSGSGTSYYHWGPVAQGLDDMRMAKPDLRFGKIDFPQGAYDAYRSSELLVSSLDYYNVGDGNHELVMPGVSKGAGAHVLIEDLVQRSGLPIRSYAFGDSENDLSLFDVVDVAVAMGQADEHVRASADVVAPTCANDGVAVAMEQLGLI